MPRPVNAAASRDARSSSSENVVVSPSEMIAGASGSASATASQICDQLRSQAECCALPFAHVAGHGAGGTEMVTDFARV